MTGIDYFIEFDFGFLMFWLSEIDDDVKKQKSIIIIESSKFLM